jgi:hypothetical protein
MTIDPGVGEVYRARDRRLGRQTAKLSVRCIVRAADSRKERYAKPNVASWLSKRSIKK